MAPLIIATVSLNYIQYNAIFHLIFCILSEMLFLPRGPWSVIRLTSFPNTCFSTCLVMSYVVQLVSEFVSTPYVLRQRHGIKTIPPPATCVMLMISRWAACPYPLRQSPHDFSPQEYAPLFPPTGAHDVLAFLSQQNNNKLYFPWTNCVLWAG